MPRKVRKRAIELVEEEEERKVQLKAKLMKIKLAAIGPATPEARRGLIQDTKSPSATLEGNNTQTQNRLRQESKYINKGIKIKPKGPDAKLSPDLKKKLAKLQQQKTAHDHGHSILMKGHNRGVYRSASLSSQQGHYAKYWLLNAKETNGNGWGIAAHSAKENMRKFIGRPLVVTSAKWRGSKVRDRYGDTFDHPYVPTNDLNKIFEHQEQYRVGNIVDVGEKNGDYYAMIEMLPKYANMTLPPFCSPAIYQLDAKEAEGQISKWEALHLAALDENPAYGARIALLKGTCVGTNHECRVQFKSAKQKEVKITCPVKLKEKVSKLKKNQKIAIRDVSEPFKRKRFLGDKPHVLHPKAKEIEAHGVKHLGVSPTFKGSHFLTTDGKLLGDGKSEHRDMSHKILKTFKDKKFNEMAATADGKKMSRWGTDGRNMGTLLEQTGMSRVSADATGINIDSKHPLTKSQRSVISQHLLDNNIGSDNVFIDDDTPSQNTIRKQLRLGKLKLKLASQGEQNMTYQESKKIKIHKKKHPEVRKAQSSVEDILRKSGRSTDGSHHQSTFLSTNGEFIGGGDIHDVQIRNILDPNGAYGETVTNDFIKKHNLGRVQTFPINRAGEKKTSVHFNSKATKDQIRAVKDLENGGRNIGFLVGDKTGNGSRDLIRALSEHK